MNITQLIDKIPDAQAASSLILIFVALLVRFAANRYVQARDGLNADQKRRLKSNIKNGLLLLLAVGLFFIWAPALRTFALSLTAFAVAIILATKELILCLSGSLVKATSGSMRVGDWVSVGHVRGEVIDQDMISTTLQELGNGPLAFEYSGKTTVIPNSLFLNTPVINERFYKQYVVHDIQFISDPDVDPEPIIADMIEVITSEMKDQKEAAQKAKSKIETRASISLPGIDGEGRIQTTNEGRLKITISCFLPTQAAVTIDQKAMIAAARNARKQRRENPGFTGSAPRG